METQRVWSWEAVDAIRRKVKNKHSGNVVMLAELRDDGYEIEVTVWL